MEHQVYQEQKDSVNSAVIGTYRISTGDHLSVADGAPGLPGRGGTLVFLAEPDAAVPFALVKATKANRDFLAQASQVRRLLCAITINQAAVC